MHQVPKSAFGIAMKLSSKWMFSIAVPLLGLLFLSATKRNDRKIIFKSADKYLAKEVVKYGGRVEPLKLASHYAPFAGYIERMLKPARHRVRRGEKVLMIRRMDRSDYLPFSIRASMHGIVDFLYFERGQTVKTGDKLFDVIQTKTLKIDLLISDKDIARIGRGANTLIGMDKVKGKVDQISNVADEWGLFPTRVTFPNTKKIGVGELVRVEIESKIPACLVRKSAVVENLSNRFVWYLDKQNVVRLREIRVVGSKGDDFIVSQGLTAGDRYLVSTGKGVYEGQVLKVRNAKKDGDLLSH